MFGKLFRRKPKPAPEDSKEPSYFDKLLSVIGDQVLSVFNGVTYNFTRCESDGNDDPLKFDTEKWFKIRIGQYISGYGDWGGGFDRATCAVVEVYIDYSGRILRVCACSPFYNSPTLQEDNALHDKVIKLVEDFNQHLSHDSLKLRTKDQWLSGVLEMIHTSVFIGEADLWKHPISITKKR